MKVDYDSKTITLSHARFTVNNHKCITVDIRSHHNC